MKKNLRYPIYYISVGLCCLVLCLTAGLLAGFQYVVPTFIKQLLPFTALRPLHTLFALSWIFMGSIGSILWYIQNDTRYRYQSFSIIKLQFWLFLLTGLAITVCYVLRKFEGKEYLEFPHLFYFPILLGWLLLAIYYFRAMWTSFASWPAYYWMWGTGMVFMIFHFTEAHMWILSYFKQDYIQNLTMQWKAGGAYVGAWNMLDVCDGENEWQRRLQPIENRFLLLLPEFGECHVQLGSSCLSCAECRMDSLCGLPHQHDGMDYPDSHDLSLENQPAYGGEKEIPNRLQSDDAFGSVDLFESGIGPSDFHPGN